MIKQTIIALLCFLAPLTGQAQSPDAGTVEVFAGAELNYADVNFLRLYNVLVNVTPGVKWHLGHDWLVAGQLFLPAVNYGYDNKHNIVRLTNATLAKQLHFGRQHFKLTGGLFGRDRYGLDLRWMMPATDWLMLEAQVGYTGAWRLAAADALDWTWDAYPIETKAVNFDAPDRLTAIVGANVWLSPWNTQFRLTAGRYLNLDYGTELQVMRHFRGCSVGLFAQLHEKQSVGRRYRTEAGGFRVVVCLPDWHWTSGKLKVRPASNFRLTYNAQADGISMQNYTTDPEENERDYPVRIPWGTGSMTHATR